MYNIAISFIGILAISRDGGVGYFGASGLIFK